MPEKANSKDWTQICEHATQIWKNVSNILENHSWSNWNEDVRHFQICEDPASLAALPLTEANLSTKRQNHKQRKPLKRIIASWSFRSPQCCLFEGAVSNPWTWFKVVHKVTKSLAAKNASSRLTEAVAAMVWFLALRIHGVPSFLWTLQVKEPDSPNTGRIREERFRNVLKAWCFFFNVFWLH